jgi:hypothetical protein
VPTFVKTIEITVHGKTPHWTRTQRTPLTRTLSASLASGRSSGCDGAAVEHDVDQLPGGGDAGSPPAAPEIYNLRSCLIADTNLDTRNTGNLMGNGAAS